MSSTLRERNRMLPWTVELAGTAFAARHNVHPCDDGCNHHCLLMCFTQPCMRSHIEHQCCIANRMNTHEADRKNSNEPRAGSGPGVNCLLLSGWFNVLHMQSSRFVLKCMISSYKVKAYPRQHTAIFLATIGCRAKLVATKREHHTSNTLN